MIIGILCKYYFQGSNTVELSKKIKTIVVLPINKRYNPMEPVRAKIAKVTVATANGLPRRSRPGHLWQTQRPNPVASWVVGII